MISFTPASKPRGSNVLNIIGAKIGMLEVKAFAGYAKTSSVFLCQCECGRTCYRRGAFLNQARWALAESRNPKGYKSSTHCGCQTWRGVASHSENQLYSRVKNRLCREWQRSRRLFHEQCWLTRPPGKTWSLVRYDTSKPLGPGNFFWCQNRERTRTTFYAAVEAIRNLSGCDRKQAVARAMNITRERRRQLVNVANGLCQRCGAVSDTATCHQCRPPKNKRYHQYPWDKWLDGQTWELTPGWDFPESDLTRFREAARRESQKRGLKLKTALREGVLRIRACGLPHG